jgi:hypothetical protein
LAHVAAEVAMPIARHSYCVGMDDTESDTSILVNEPTAPASQHAPFQGSQTRTGGASAGGGTNVSIEPATHA